MREVVLDTGNNGPQPRHRRSGGGDRLCGGDQFLPTGRTFQVYLDPEMSMPYGAWQIHGLTDEFLRGKLSSPRIAGISSPSSKALKSSPTTPISTSVFERRARPGRPPLHHIEGSGHRTLGPEKYPGAQNSLDALCRRFNIDTSAREKHGALLDADLLAQVYLEIVGGRQPGLTLAATPTAADQMAGSANGQTAAGPLRAPREHRPSDDELIAHAAFVKP